VSEVLKNYFSLNVDRPFCKMVTVETNKFALFSQKKREACSHDTNWVDPIAGEIEAYIGVLIYMGIVGLQALLGYYFYGGICVCSILKQAMTRKWFRKIG
jgi:hypothetical protein